MPAKHGLALVLLLGVVALLWRANAERSSPTPLPVVVTGRLLAPDDACLGHASNRVVTCFNYQVSTQRLHVDETGQFRVQVDFPWFDDARRSVRFQVADDSGNHRFGAEVDLSFDINGTHDLGDVELFVARHVNSEWLYRERIERREPRGSIDVSVEPRCLAGRVLFEIVCHPEQRAAVLTSRHTADELARFKTRFPSGLADIKVWDGERLLEEVRDVIVPEGGSTSDARLAFDLRAHYRRTTIRNAHQDSSMRRRMRIDFRADDSDAWCATERPGDATSVGYSLSGRGDVRVSGRGLRTRVYRDVPSEFVVDWRNEIELAIALAPWPDTQPVEDLWRRWRPVLDPPAGVPAQVEIQYAGDLGVFLAWPTLPGPWTLRWTHVDPQVTAALPVGLRGTRTLDVRDAIETQLVHVPF